MSGPDQTRRDFLKALAIGLAGVVVGAGGMYLAAPKKGVVRTVTIPITETLIRTVTEVKTETRTVTAAPKPVLKTVALGQCRFCGVGCGVAAQVLYDPTTGFAKDIKAIMGLSEYPVNRGALCVKGFYIHKSLGWGGNTEAMRQRLKKPLVRKDWIIPGKNRPPITLDEIRQAPRVARRTVTKDVLASKTPADNIRENFVEVDWDTAVKFFATLLEYGVKKYGPHVFAYYGSGQLGTEESYVINKLTKAGMQTNNLDGNPRLCMVSAVGGYITSYGADEPEVSCDHIDVPEPDLGVHADTFLLIGTNTAEAHPIVFGRISAVKQADPERVKVILADPRKTKSGAIADLWLPLRWSMDVAFMHTLAHTLVYELDGCDPEKVDRCIDGDLDACREMCRWEYVDVEYLRRHVNFAIPVDTKKSWARTDYNTPENRLGDHAITWDMGTTAAELRPVKAFKAYPSPGKRYASEEEVERDWWKGFALYLKFLQYYKPSVMAKLVFGDEKPLIKKGEAYEPMDQVEALRKAAEWLAKGRTLVFWTMGVNQKIQGVHAVNSIINFLLLTGKVGKYGAGSFSLTGQPNACGGIRDQGGLAHVLPYGRLIAKKPAREAVENVWRRLTESYLRERGVGFAKIRREVGRIKIHPKPGPHAIELFRRVGSGAIKIVWIAETNPGHSLPNVFKFRHALAKPHDDDPAFPFVVVSDIYPTRTTDLADLVLPAAGWAEKEFKYGSSERRYTVTPYVIQPPGECVGDAVIFAMLGKELEDRGLVPQGLVSGLFPEDVDKAAKAAGKSWVSYVVEKSRERRWHEEFMNRVWDRDILALAKDTYYDFTYVRREALRKMTNGFRWPWPEQYITNPSVRSRYDRYKACSRYSYPYDPLMPDPDDLVAVYEAFARTDDPEELKAYVDALDPNRFHPGIKKWLRNLASNPVYGRWVLGRVVEEIRDVRYKAAAKVPNGWYLVFYAKPDGRALVWARPWLPVRYNEAAKRFEVVKEVTVYYRRMDNSRAWGGAITIFPDERGPYVTVRELRATPASGDPEEALRALEEAGSWSEAVRRAKEHLEALFAVALAPAEVPGFRLAYRLETGEVVTVRDAEGYDLVATQGRIVEHWHTSTMTMRVPEIRRVKPEAYVEINKELAAELGISTGDWVVVESPRGKVVLKARVLDPRTALGGPRKDYVFVPWFDEYKLANVLTIDVFDVQPYFFQPDFKTTAARVRKARADEVPVSAVQQTASPAAKVSL